MSFLDRFRGGKGGGKSRGASAFGDTVDRSRWPAGDGAPANPAGLTLEFDNSSLSEGPFLASSIIAEATPSELPEAPPSRAPAAPPQARGLPGIGGLGHGVQRLGLAGALVLGLLGLLLVAVGALNTVNQDATRAAAFGEALTQSQRVAKAASQALPGNSATAAELKDSVTRLASTVRSLRSGGGPLPLTPESAQPLLQPLMPLVERTEKDATTLLGLQAELAQVAQALREINRQSTDLLALAEAVAVPRPDLSATEAAAAGRLLMLSQRIGKSAGELLADLVPDASAHLERDLDLFRTIAEGMLGGSTELRLPGTRDAAARLQIQNLLAQFEKTRAEATSALGGLQGQAKAREAQARILADSESLRTGLLAAQAQGQGVSALDPSLLAVGSLSLLLATVGALGLFLLYAQQQRRRASLAEAQREEAERLEQQAKRVNDANQAAILRLMNELQTVAEGDLTQQATVTEDITGAIADSVNYTVEELRSLVAQVQGTAARVTDTTQQVEMTSTELLAASDEQLREIRETGESVLQMASRINEVSAQAGQSAQVARQSLVAAESGLQAVQNAIGGMNTLRDQIQDTSKRIKRLGESSQEIGEITELISDITEQTNVLALNAAIQAASAGEAGRGFSVVAEEVQRLAERSADATRQIAALVKTIQTDTQDAVAAMERSTQGVVEGARLSDSAGAALGEIDHVSRRLAELIERISAETSGEARSANVVATNIQHIFAVTEQTGEGTRSTAGLVRELSRTAEELKASVARFKIR